MPAVVSNRDGSSGMRDELGQRREPLLSKYERNDSRISAVFN
jgi:hypothetical protein